MTSFSSLMAISATQTREAQQLVQSKLEERNRKIAEQKRLQEEKEAKEREQERKLRIKRFEEEKRQKELAAKREEERKAREAALQKREEEHRIALLYGPKKAAKLSSSAGSTNGSSGGSKWPTSTSGVKDAVRRRRLPGDEDDEPSGIVLTREELRQRKQQAEMRKLFATSKRSSHTTLGFRKKGLQLPGGAVNIVKRPDDPSVPPSSSTAGMSVKDRLAAQPNTLTLLNTKKKDKRTEDEILEEVRARRKVISGMEALAFDDWFGDSKKKDKELSSKKTPGAVSASSTPPPAGINSPAPRIAKSQPPPISTSVSASSSQRNGAIVARPSSAKPTLSASQKALASSSRASSTDLPPSASSTQSKLPKSLKGPTSATATHSHRPSAISASSSSHRERERERERDRDRDSRPKRPRSTSLSDSPPPPKRRAQSQHYDDDDGDDDDAHDLKSEIWKIFGKNRDTYTSRDVFSDDEDMEVDASALEREEKISSRIAQREEMLALEEERRHEEEKRQRKKERERALARAGGW